MGLGSGAVPILNNQDKTRYTASGLLDGDEARGEGG